MADAPKDDTQPASPDAGGSRGRRRLVTILIAAAAAAVAAGGTAALLINVFERKQEARYPFFRVVELDEQTTDPEVWGKNFPHQYDSYKQTVDMVRTRFGGSEAMPRPPSEADPRSIVSRSLLEEDPRLRTFWAGYAFAHDAREARGHAYMLLDQRLTRRHEVADQPGACLHCHASTKALYDELGDGDVMEGFHAVNRMTYEDVTKHAEHPVACIDCHAPDTMALRVTRPAFMVGIRELKKHQGIEDFDVNRDATRREMRSYVCGQCHVEYYFAGPDKTLTYPWSDGIRADEIYAYYQEIDFADWTHAETGARTLKAQHPEFEMWNQGPHAAAGVTCPDCHMPYGRVGAHKVSDHQVRSPLLNISNACRTCHRGSEQEIAERASVIQERTFQVRNLAMDAVMALIADLREARDEGRPDEALFPARQMQREATFLLDFVEAENSMGFHAPQESMRVLSLAIEAARKGQILVRQPDWQPPEEVRESPVEPARERARPATEAAPDPEASDDG
jgi:nitrite reductase (cytochrome c-552)